MTAHPLRYAWRYDRNYCRIAARLVFLLVSLLFLPPNIVSLKAETLKIGVSPWHPWIIKDKEGYSGIALDICKAAIRRAGHTYVVIEVPQKRRDLLEWGRSVNVEPGVEKKWRVRQEDVSVYTEPYIQTRNVIVSRRGCYPAAGPITAFYGSTVGANAGYYYTDGLSQAFEQKLIIRDDCRAGHMLVSKLVKKRFNAIVADTYEWKYWMQALGQDLTDFEESYTFSHINHLRIRLHREKAYLLTALNRALEEMRADGTIDIIVKRFLPE